MSFPNTLERLNEAIEKLKSELSSQAPNRGYESS